MFVTLSPFKGDDSSYGTFLGLLKFLKNLGNDVESRLMNALVYDQKFVKYWMKVLNEVYPNFCLIGNTFLQQSTLEELVNSGTIELYICSQDREIEKYKTGRMYDGLYKSLKKTCKTGLYLNIEPDAYVTTYLNTEDLAKITLVIWRETHMGEITDAITKALQGINSDVGEDEVKQAMANLGMSVEGYESQNTEDEPVEETQMEETKPIMNPPEPEDDESSQDDEDQMCCKISGNTMVLMFPKDTEFNSITIGDVEFNTLTVSLPDVSSTKLQVLDIIHQIQQKSEQPKIVRVPIFLPKETKPEKKVQTRVENADLEQLRQQKAEIDAKIKQARSNNDSGLVEQLRKERRKLRAEINKLGGGE